MQPNNGQTNPLLYSDPIPGGEAFPNERLENGEIQNPYYNEGFENLSDDDKEVRDESETKRSGNDAVAQQFNQQWDADKSINLENVKQAVEGNYADGAIEQSVTSTSAQADISEAERNAKDIPDADTPQQGDQPHDAAEATAKLAIHTSEIGEKAAEASADTIREIVKDANMVFVAAGMGGGTGTGAAPVVAKIAKDAGALVVAIVTRPFTFEGKKRVVNSIDGLNKLRANVDSIIVVSNDKLLMTSGNAPISQAFNESDNVLAQSVKTVVNLILLPAVINLDFADVRNTLKDAGVSLIGFGMGIGQNRAKDAANAALSSPLLEASITGARRAIVSVTCGPNVSLFDAQETVNLLIDASGHDIDVKFGVAINDQLSDEILVSVIASDFEEEVDFSQPSLLSSTIVSPRENADIFKAQDAPASTPNDEPKEEEITDDSILPSFLKD